MRQMWCFCSDCNEKDQFCTHVNDKTLFDTAFEALADASGELLLKVEVCENGDRLVTDRFDASTCLHHFALRLVQTANPRFGDMAGFEHLMEVKQRWLSHEVNDEALQVARERAASDEPSNEMELAMLCASSPSALNAARLTARLLDTDADTHQRMATLMDEIVADYKM
ncbi:MAG: hypothetical protein AAF438_13290 [Pseudomonadota bacterium]